MDVPHYTILIVDDSPEDRLVIRRLLTRALSPVYRVVEAGDGRSGIQRWHEEAPDCVLLDYHLPDTDGLRLLETIAAEADGIAPVVMLTGSGSADIAVEALKRGAQDYLPKERLRLVDLQLTIAMAIEKVQLRHDQQRMVLELRDREARYRGLVDASTDLIWRTDAQGRAFDITGTWEALTGQTQAESRDTGWLTVIHPDDQARTLALWQTAVATEQVYRNEFRARTSDGSYRSFEARGVPIRNADGSVREWIGTNTDITARKQAEDALRESEARLRLALNAAVMGVWSWDIIHNHVDWSPEQYALFGVETFEGTPDAFGKFLHPDDAPRVWAAFDLAITQGTVYEAEFRIRRGDGEQRWIFNSGRASYDAVGQPVRVLGVAWDVTARKQAEAERMRLYAEAQQARAIAEDAVMVRDQFLSIAAHELKNPLTSLLGHTELLLRRAQRSDAFSERDRRQLVTIHDQGVHLNRLITQLLDVSRIEIGQLVIQSAAFDLAALVRRMVENTRLSLKHHSLASNITATPVMIHGDAIRLEQVVSNLLSNAVKYSPNGGEIMVQLEQQDHEARLLVRDSGIGVPQSELPNLFRRFYRAENAVTQSISGTGIGLFVVKEIIDQHGGTITAHSQECVGSTFIVTLPLMEIADTETATTAYASRS